MVRVYLTVSRNADYALGKAVRPLLMVFFRLGNDIRTPDTTKGGNWVDTIALAKEIGKIHPGI